MEYCAALRKSTIISLAARSMKPENIFLSDAHQEERDKYRMISLIVVECLGSNGGGSDGCGFRIICIKIITNLTNTESQSDQNRKLQKEKKF